jgi:hypothetical protein
MTTFKTPQDFFNMTTSFFKAVPKTPTEAKAAMEKVQTVIKTEFDNSQEVMKTYAKAVNGDATPKEITAANKKAVELVKATTFASMLAVPGAIFVLPAIVEKAKEYSIDLVPASVAAQFDI